MWHPPSSAIGDFYSTRPPASLQIPWETSLLPPPIAPWILLAMSSAVFTGSNTTPTSSAARRDASKCLSSTLRIGPSMSNAIASMSPSSARIALMSTSSQLYKILRAPAFSRSLMFARKVYIGMAITRHPAASAAKIPFIESSKTSIFFWSTPSSFAARM